MVTHILTFIISLNPSLQQLRETQFRKSRHSVYMRDLKTKVYFVSIVIENSMRKQVQDIFHIVKRNLKRGQESKWLLRRKISSLKSYNNHNSNSKWLDQLVVIAIQLDIVRGHKHLKRQVTLNQIPLILLESSGLLINQELRFLPEMQHIMGEEDPRIHLILIIAPKILN